MKLIVGLGNPGHEYDNTRHNIGFIFLDKFVKNEFNVNKKMNAMECIDTVNGEKIIYVKPLSFMNLSGNVVLNYVNYYKIKLSDILVIQDDLDMDVGKIKLMNKHGAGGHNGIKNIIECLGTNDFLRLKIGISKNKLFDTKDYVLGKFSQDELNILNDTWKKLDSFLDDYLNLDRDRFIQRYNSK